MVVAALPLRRGVTIGRLLVRATVASMLSGRWRARTRWRRGAFISHGHVAAVTKLIQPVGHHTLTGSQAGFHGEKIAVLRPQDDFPDRYRVFGINDVDEVSGRAVLYGRRGYRHP